jgi:putative uncharacterized protein (fragment)
MGEYITDKNKMKFQSQDALKTVENVINEATVAIDDKSKTVNNSPLGETAAGALGAGAGAGIGFAGLYLGGSVAGLSAAGITSGLAAAGALIGGGMAAGVAVLAAPAVILGGVGVGVASHFKNKKLREAKNIVYKNALAKQTAIMKALKEESDADKERLDYLNGLNVLLKAAIKDLGYDLGIDA